MASDCDKEVERIVREGCMMIDDWVFGNTLAEDKYPPLKECLVRIVTDALRIPADCVRMADGRIVKVLGTLPMTADGVVVVPTGLDERPVYLWNNDQWHNHATLIQRADGRWGGEFGQQWRFVEDCYSTREAAEAALGKQCQRCNVIGCTGSPCVGYPEAARGEGGK
jgi:hypothetical protein